ncbi:phosphotransferase [Glycomyces sp. TRM65418]|uniref:phosphotransferase family protein n=1 Tax=Glycomyces sp. TRM65418 TaxID=2867006 RepID=UPI001CE5A9DB|nr:phosphotransferase [Glycomyces sp. TRM65418]MCC3765049.1 phosphotransferase [Glycomyces sp. TRM65418]QZD54679.1 phosphotransferase [Glycomyces sp. TRM65418]
MASSEALAALARRYRVDPRAVAAAPFQGVANRVYLLGDHLVLRIARPGSADDLRKEASVIPAAVRAGVLTPAMVAFDDGDELFGSPYMVVRRANGIAPGLPDGPDDERWRTLYRELGGQLAALHEGVPALPEVPADTASDPRPDVAALAEAGYLSADVAAWVVGWFDRLEPRIPATPRARLIHGDASPTNLLADPESGRLTAILDWGDAAWADPAVEFAKLPLRALPTVLEGYLGGQDESWAARVLWHHLHWAIGRLATPPDRQGGHWSAQPGNRLLEVMRFLLADPPPPWPALR